MKSLMGLLLISVLLTNCTHQIPKTVKSGYLDYDHGKIYYQIYGKGDPIIVLHGGPGLDHNYLMPQMQELTKHHQVIFYDQRGGGKSTGTPYNEKYISHTQFVEDLEALRKSLGYEKITLLGHSYGGTLVMKYATKYPTQVKSIILADTSAATLRGNKAFMDEFRKRIATVKGSFDPTKPLSETEKYDPDTMRKYMQATFSVYFYDPKKLDELTLNFTKDSLEGFWKTYAIMMGGYETKPFDLRPKLSKLKIPTLIIHGEQDIVPVSVAEEVHKTIPGSELVVIKECDHFPHIEKPQEFFGAIEKFLGTAKAKL